MQIQTPGEPISGPEIPVRLKHRAAGHSEDPPQPGRGKAFCENSQPVQKPQQAIIPPKPARKIPVFPETGNDSQREMNVKSSGRAILQDLAGVRAREGMNKNKRNLILTAF